MKRCKADIDPPLTFKPCTVGQPLDEPPAQGRRRSELITPVPKPRKKKNKPEQGRLALGDKEGLSTAEQEYNPTPIINEIRSHVVSWHEAVARSSGTNAQIDTSRHGGPIDFHT
jgi:hypothetical protein